MNSRPHKAPADKDISQISQNYIVTRHNALIESEYNLTISEQKILLVLASKVNPKKDKELKKYYFKISEIAEVLGIREDSYFSRVRKMLRQLQSKQLVMYPRTETGELDFEQEPEYFTWLIYQKYEKNGIIALQFHPDLTDYFTELTEDYTPMQLQFLLRMTSYYSLRMYELLRKQLYRKQVDYDLGTLRWLLEVPDDKLKLYGHFKDKAIKRALEEINEKTDIYFEFDEIKTGKKVTGIRFFVKKNPRNPVENTVITPLEQLEEKPAKPKVSKTSKASKATSWRTSLEEIGLTEKEINALLNKYTEYRIIKNLQYFKERKLRTDLEPIEKETRYIKMAISRDYAKSEANEQKDTTTTGKAEKINVQNDCETLKKVEKSSSSKDEDVALRGEIIKYLDKRIEEEGKEILKDGLDFESEKPRLTQELQQAGLALGDNLEKVWSYMVYAYRVKEM